MSKTELKKKFEDLKQKVESTRPQPTGHPYVIIHMWCPDGVSPKYTGGKTRVIASNAGEIYE